MVTMVTFFLRLTVTVTKVMVTVTKVVVTTWKTLILPCFPPLFSDLLYEWKEICWKRIMDIMTCSQGSFKNYATAFFCEESQGLFFVQMLQEKFKNLAPNFGKFNENNSNFTVLRLQGTNAENCKNVTFSVIFTIFGNFYNFRCL